MHHHSPRPPFPHAAPGADRPPLRLAQPRDQLDAHRVSTRPFQGPAEGGRHSAEQRSPAQPPAPRQLNDAPRSVWVPVRSAISARRAVPAWPKVRPRTGTGENYSTLEIAIRSHALNKVTIFDCGGLRRFGLQPVARFDDDQHWSRSASVVHGRKAVVSRDMKIDTAVNARGNETVQHRRVLSAAWR